VNNVPTSKGKPITPRTPIVLRLVTPAKEDSLIVSQEVALPSAGVPSNTADLPPVVPFPSASESPRDTPELLTETTELRRSLEHWTAAETEWNGQRRLFKVMTENVSDFIVLMNQEGNRIWNNPSYNHAMGYSAQELAGSHALSEVHPDDRSRAMDALQKALDKGTAQQVEYRVQQKEGGWLQLQTEMVPILDPDSRVESVVLLGRDVTENKNLEEALALASTQATAAGMVERMARDFDQILTNVFGNLTIAKNLNGPHNAVAVRLQEIERSLQRARDLLEQMFSVSAQSESPKVQVMIEPLIQEAIDAVLRGTMIRAEYVFPRSLPELDIDVESFSHAIRNIATNSMQAMDKGVVKVTAEYVPQEHLAGRSELALKPGNYICIRIQDQGRGMSERTLNHAFEPYFTTNQGSQGLGLTTALSAIQRMGGTIYLESTASVGTTAYIYLPATSNNVSTSAITTTLPKQGVKKRILLMDDEQMILDIVSRMLTHLGYDVTTCTDGSQAIAAYTKAKMQSQMFDVVLMDLIVPNGVGGQDAVHTIRKINPHAKVIANSGHLDHPVMMEYKKHGFTAALEKPYKLEKLQQVIEAVIDSSV